MKDTKIVASTFDPENPEDFTYLHNWDVRKLTKKARKAYMVEEEKWQAWKAAERKKLLMKPMPSDEEQMAEYHASKDYLRDIDIQRDLEANDHDRRNARGRIQSREQNIRLDADNVRRRAKWITDLGSALIKEGFDIVYNARGSWREEYVIDPSWAHGAKIMKEGQEVGSFSTWTPKDSWGRRESYVGWVISANRHEGRYGGLAEKRYKNLENAVKFIKENAIPKRDVEQQLRDAKAEQRRLEGYASAVENSIRYLADGIKKERYSSVESNGKLNEIFTAYRDRNPNTMFAILQAMDEEMKGLEAQLAEANELATAHRDETLLPLMKQASKEVPEVYS